MRFVPSADRVPNRCAFIPSIGSNHGQGFVTSDTLVDDFFSTYISVVALKEIANKIPQAGLAPREELTLAQAEIAALKAENEDLRAQMAEYDKELDAVSYLKGRGYQPVKRAGRPPAAKKAA